jgi:hypothetical protein
MKTTDMSIESTNDLSTQKFYHGTKSSLRPGDLIEPDLIQITVRTGKCLIFI